MQSSSFLLSRGDLKGESRPPLCKQPLLVYMSIKKWMASDNTIVGTTRQEAYDCQN